ncbi:MAG: HD domain-containing phosphohydrolase, partial [Candidatus Omnitrophota bacterium]
LIAQELKTNPKLKMDNKFLEDLHMESRLHDIGKIAVPDEILNKPGKLTTKEFNEIKRHPSESARILAPLEGVKDSIDVIYNHHERIDGRGYPEGRSGKDIPLRAKIIAVADAFDAMTSDRPYRRAIPENLALNELEKNRDRQFDGKVVNAFLNIRKKKGKLAKEEVLLNT